MKAFKSRLRVIQSSDLRPALVPSFGPPSIKRFDQQNQQQSKTFTGQPNSDFITRVVGHSIYLLLVDAHSFFSFFTH